MRIGILGGTFNPVHNGHLYIAGQALKRLALDKVIFIPTFIPPHKNIKERINPVDRLHMLKGAIRGKRRFSVSLYEMRKKGTSYSIRTVKYLKKRYGKNTKLFFLMGADSASGLGKWKDAFKLLRLLQFVVVPRKGFKINVAFPGVRALMLPKKDISSIKIRKLVSSGRSIKRLVPACVRKYIKRKKLYEVGD